MFQKVLFRKPTLLNIVKCNLSVDSHGASCGDNRGVSETRVFVQERVPFVYQLGDRFACTNCVF